MLVRPEDLSGLMRAGRSGDEAAYRRLLEALTRRLRVVVKNGLRRYGRGDEDIEDVVQETLLAIHLKRHTWDENQPIEPWVRAIAHHKLVDSLRRRGFRQLVDINDYSEDLSVPATAESDDARECADLLAALTPRQRELVEAISIEGRSAREVGDRLGMSEGAVRVALHRALKTMAAARLRGDA